MAKLAHLLVKGRCFPPGISSTTYPELVKPEPEIHLGFREAELQRSGCCSA